MWLERCEERCIIVLGNLARAVHGQAVPATIRT